MNKPSLKRMPEMQHVEGTGVGLARVALHPVFICLLLAVITFAVYWPVLNYGFVNYDDADYFSANSHVQAGLTWEGVAWAFRATADSSWYPLTWLSFMLDVNLFRIGPAGPHFMNLLFHTANTVLLFLLLRRLTGTRWRSALVAGLFALHPLHVESVAWISERKDVLSTFFGLLTLWAYSRYAAFEVSRVKCQAGPKRWYGLALLFFALGLLSKPMVVTLPFVMLLLDYWPLGRVSSFKCQVSSGVADDMATSFAPFSFLRSPGLRRLVWEKVPFFALGAISCAVTFFVHKETGAIVALAALSFAARIANAFVSYARYLGKTFWPAGLALPYPHPGQWPMILVVCATALVMGLCIAAVWLGRRRPYFFVGWYWFLGTLIPVIGVIQWGSQAMADRFTYVPLIGIFIILAWGAGEVLGRWQRLKVVMVSAAMLVLAVCGVRTRDQLHYWQNSETLFRHAIAVTKNNYVAYDCLAMALETSGRTEEATDNYRRALQINPTFDEAHFKLAVVLAGRRKFDEAIAQYREALRINPRSTDAHLNLGSAFLWLGRLSEAQDEFTKALKINPQLAMGYYNLANVFDLEGRPDEAVRNYQEALRLKPDYAEARNNLACLLVTAGRLDEAEAQFREALRAKPDYPEAHASLGSVLVEQGRFEEAVGHYRQALQFNPKNAQIRVGLGSALARLGRREEAIEQFTEALRLDPNNNEAKEQLRALGMQTTQ